MSERQMHDSPLPPRDRIWSSCKMRGLHKMSGCLSVQVAWCALTGAAKCVCVKERERGTNHVSSFLLGTRGGGGPGTTLFFWLEPSGSLDG